MFFIGGGQLRTRPPRKSNGVSLRPQALHEKDCAAIFQTVLKSAQIHLRMALI